MVREKVQGQCSGQGISAPRKEVLSVYQWCVSDKKAGWLRKCFCNTLLNFLGFALEILEKSNFIASVIPRKCNTRWKYQGQQSGPCLYPLEIPSPFYFTPENSTCSPAVISMSSNLLFGFFYWKSLIQNGVWTMANSE